ncbi:hypothetical protein PPROV_000915100 [Pycnococcus provasolii]|uniref:Amino acid transporter transmembrane domain-containing protein n=1 Tax=Pycnococcus provasolii TaxID=41880 RepID=A0A830HX90_9CHLO|nr:hypothetical protein PPROV_000915100 [Pycnococcus provasolii]|mmetsp:Transcript_8674/g.23240  ORF Transcript_8674/g.23240 Transcript_8674/m.23240 type:complete len:494 (-) Transcript_8674:3003-4484(-)
MLARHQSHRFSYSKEASRSRPATSRNRYSSSSSYARRVCAASCDAPLSNDIKDATVVVGVQARRRRTGVVTKCSAAASVPASDATPPAETQQSSSAGSQNTATPTDAIINVVKAIMGAGAFALPWAFTQGGLILTPIALVVSCILSLYSLSMLCRATDLAVTNNLATTEEVANYSGVAKAAMGKVGNRLTVFMNLITVFGIACAYLVFLANTIGSTPFASGFSNKALIYGMMPFMCALSWLRQLGGVSIISAFGNFTVVLGMSFVTWYASGLMTPTSMSALPMFNLSAFSKFFGPVAFLFFTHFSLPTVRGGMAEPKKFFNAAVVGFVLCGVVSILFGAYAAIAFGPSVPSVVVAALEGSSMATIVKLLLCANLLSTFPVVARSAFLILENLTLVHTDPEAAKAGKELGTVPALAIRTAFVVFAAVISASIPNFGVVTSFVGGFCCAVLTLVLPPVMLHFITKKSGKSLGAEAPLVWMTFLIGVACSIASVVL